MSTVIESCISDEDEGEEMSFTMKSTFGADSMSPFKLRGTGVDDAEDMILRGFDANRFGIFGGTCAVVNQGGRWKLAFVGEREWNIAGDTSPPTGTRETNLPEYLDSLRDFQLYCSNSNSLEIRSISTGSLSTNTYRLN